MKLHFQVLLMIALLLPACGYQFAGRQPSTRVVLNVVNDSEEPGMPLALRRGIAASAERAGISLAESSQQDVPLLEVTIEKVEWELAGTQVVSGGGERDVGASVWDVRLEVQARLLDVDGHLLGERRVTEVGSYSETGLASATEERRQLALRRVAGPTSDLLVALIVTKLASDGTSR